MTTAGEVNHEVVIVGAGIVGLATALALHRKGIKSVVLERSEFLRSSEGAAIGIRQNGWRALDQLGVADSLRQSALSLQRERDVCIDNDKYQGGPMIGETRWLKRRDLINTLSRALPPGTVQFGHQIVSISVKPHTNYPMLQLLDGRSMVTKVLIGCDGANSVVADYLDVKPAKMYGCLCELQGLSNYPNGHAFGSEFVRFRKNRIMVGRIPINDNLVHWFVTVKRTSVESKITREPELVRRLTLELVKDFPHEIKEMIKCSDHDSLSCTRLRYRTPWDLLMGRFRKGTVTVAGDAMHVMGPFLGQGGAAGLEDSVVLARSLAQKLSSNNLGEIEEAIDEYIKARRMRVLRLSTQTYLSGQLLESSSSLKKFVIILLMIVLFYDRKGHTKYNCGSL